MREIVSSGLEVYKTVLYAWAIIEGINAFYQFHLEGHWEPYKEVGSPITAFQLVWSKLGTFLFDLILRNAVNTGRYYYANLKKFFSWEYPNSSFKKQTPISYVIIQSNCQFFAVSIFSSWLYSSEKNSEFSLSSPQRLYLKMT